MASDVWHAYGVTGAPWFVAIADGAVVDEGPAPAEWEGVEALLSFSG
jgi:hypothetical protein